MGLFSGLPPLNPPHSPPHHRQDSLACCQGLLLLPRCLIVRPDVLGSLPPASSSCRGSTADEPPRGDAADTLSSWTAACKRRSRTIGEHETGAVHQCRRARWRADSLLSETRELSSTDGFQQPGSLDTLVLGIVISLW